MSEHGIRDEPGSGHSEPMTSQERDETVRYWVNLFTAQTWYQAKDAPQRAAWYAERNRKLRAELVAGDVLIFYVSKIGFTAAVRAEGRPLVVDDGPFGETFPVMVPVEPIVELELEEALPISELRTLFDDDLPVWLVQGSGTEWPTDIGERTLTHLREWARDPSRQELTPSQLDHRPRSGIASSLGEVDIPEPEDEEALSESGEASKIQERPDIEVTEHVRVQASLLRIGRMLGLTPWVTPDDQSKTDKRGTRLDEMDGVTTDLPSQFDEATNRTIRHIDVMWLHRNRVDAAFEVESTTSIYSGLLRMADLLALQPNISIPLFILVPDQRLDRALRQLRRPVFRAMVQPLPEFCRVITFSRLDELERLVENLGGHLGTSVLDEYSVSASSEE